jgi:hypothetical protein
MISRTARKCSIKFAFRYAILEPFFVKSDLKSCDVCKATSLLTKKCGGCLLRVYCGKECQRKDWKDGGHKKECGK